MVNDIVIVNQSIMTSLLNDIVIHVVNQSMMTSLLNDIVGTLSKTNQQNVSNSDLGDLVYKRRVHKHKYFEELNLKVCRLDNDKWDP